MVEHLEVRYVDGSKGRLFCLLAHRQDCGHSLVRGNESADFNVTGEDASNKTRFHLVLFVQPFGEEINLCRRFFSLVRAQLTQAGMVSVLPDMYGTGDSEGSFDDADWDLWQDDLNKVLQHFTVTRTNDQRPIRISIVAIRAGCLFAAELIQSLNKHPESFKLGNLVFIHPEHSGRNTVDRLFRARIMAQRLAGDSSERLQDLWAQIDRGIDVHACGSTLPSRLCRSLSKQSLESLLKTSLGENRAWFNVQGLLNANPIGSEKLSTWDVHNLPSALFWQAYDAEPDAALIDAVVKATVR